MSTKPVVFALNGPPGSGKDTLASELLSKYKIFAKYCVKDPLLAIARRDPIYGHVINHVWAPGADHSLKDMEVTLANGNKTTPRAMLIEIATRLRQTHGENCFSRIVAEKIVRSSSNKIILITDLGFECELNEMEKNCNVVLIRMSRKGCSFDKDSRSYLERPNMICISNDSSVGDLADRFMSALSSCV